MIGSDNPGKYPQPALLNAVIVVAFAKPHTPHLQHTQSPAGSTVVRRELFHFDDAMREAEHVRISADSAIVHPVIQQQRAVVLYFTNSCLRSINSRRYRNAVSAIRRNSDSESNTTRTGWIRLISSSNSSLTLVSSISDGWKTVVLASGRMSEAWIDDKFEESNGIQRPPVRTGHLH